MCEFPIHFSSNTPNKTICGVIISVITFSLRFDKCNVSICSQIHRTILFPYSFNTRWKVFIVEWYENDPFARNFSATFPVTNSFIPYKMQTTKYKIKRVFVRNQSNDSFYIIALQKPLSALADSERTTNWILWAYHRSQSFWILLREATDSREGVSISA